MIVPPPRPGPAPRQAIPGNIRSIHFPTVGGLVFFRVNQSWTGSAAGPNGVAFVSGLPNGWDQFDMFSGSAQRDPSVPAGTSQPGISDPVNNAMLSYYRWWPHDARVMTNTTKPGEPGLPIVIVDTANWNLIYNHFVTSRLVGPYSRDQALAIFKGLAGSNGYEFYSDPSLMGVGIFTNDFHEIAVPSPEFYAAAASAGWTYHEEVGPTSTVFKSDYTATWLLNLTKLFKDVPKVNGKKPATYTFRIDMVTQNLSGGGVTWKLQASADTTRVSTPPKSDDGRRAFPVHDTGTGDTVKHLVPVFPFPDSTADVTVQDPKAASYVDVKITFGTPKVKPKVEIIDHSTSGGTIG